MFSRRERLPRAAFSATLLVGRRFSSPNFSVISPKGQKGYAVVISKKVARLSVTRHLIKRRVLAVLRTLPLPPSLIIFPKAAVNSIRYQDIKDELGGLISKIN